MLRRIVSVACRSPLRNVAYLVCQQIVDLKSSFVLTLMKPSRSHSLGDLLLGHTCPREEG